MSRHFFPSSPREERGTERGGRSELGSRVRRLSDVVVVETSEDGVERLGTVETIWENSLFDLRESLVRFVHLVQSTNEATIALRHDGDECLSDRCVGHEEFVRNVDGVN